MQYISHTRFEKKLNTLYASLVPSVAIGVVFFYAFWWFSRDHIPQNFSDRSSAIDILLFLIVSYVIWHPIIMEILTWCISSFIQPIPKKRPESGLKVAFITTFVPGVETIDLLHTCLPAMVAAEYPHDTWLLDEGDHPDVKKICKLYGVKHFSRYGDHEYNTKHGKYVAKTKGGNHNSWYDSHGNMYDIVAQIDTDFIPHPSFLMKTLGYFRDSTIAFVGTPQIYGNTNESVIARGAAEQQYSFYGTVLQGMSGMGTTLLIGANHIIRVNALKEVDHYSAHITEDLLTGMKLHARGWKSIYIAEPLAIGEGPSTWKSYFNQQTRWAYGCVDILFFKSFRMYMNMEVRRAFYYFFLQQYYFSGIAMALSLFLLGLYFFFGIQSASVDPTSFFILYGTTMMTCWLMAIWLRRYHVGSEIRDPLLLSGMIVSIAAWPIYFKACLRALFQRKLLYTVTPKGKRRVTDNESEKIFSLHTFFGMFSLACILSSFFTGRQDPIMLCWAYISSLCMLSVSEGESVVKGIQSFFYGVRIFFTDISSYLLAISEKKS